MKKLLIILSLLVFVFCTAGAEYPGQEPELPITTERTQEEYFAFKNNQFQEKQQRDQPINPQIFILPQGESTKADDAIWLEWEKEDMLIQEDAHNLLITALEEIRKEVDGKEDKNLISVLIKEENEQFEKDKIESKEWWGLEIKEEIGLCGEDEEPVYSGDGIFLFCVNIDLFAGIDYW